ncbi:uncharacterized protein LOC119462924 isoform X2 [Dermacentor silvarum]|uniref:uncharacterized protein LOC119462924 isoform X1 n=1 Tax=Dermacentor silvarum TaxID=543639 RepID=UPI001897316C|nr:uncharacterized protein LOC119462924 isoform X1 [Dermacentor silvarum]XP_049528269.1 uncharacterized protein LOC119462924 isoform X2 [Dermacentor silvarum]
MKAATLGLAFTLACTIFITDAAELGFADFRKGLFNINPGKLTPQCKKVMKNCVGRMMGLMRQLDTLGRHWDEFTQVPCVKGSLVDKFPDYSVDCSRSGKFGKSLDCFRNPATLAVLGHENSTQVQDAFQCVWENSKE